MNGEPWVVLVGVRSGELRMRLGIKAIVRKAFKPFEAEGKEREMRRWGRG